MAAWRTALLAIALALAALPARAAPPPDLDAVAERALATFGVPGAAMVIVECDEVIDRGYGVRKLGEAARVDADTQFPIGSNTKAMTAAALAILADDGRLDWDDPVIDRLPGFRMSDAYVTSNLTVRDLLVHRSGLTLGMGDLLFWPGTDFTRAELIERIGRLPIKGAFRAGYAYDNVLYIVAGEVVAATAGTSWDEFMSARLFAPLGMGRTVTSIAGLDPANSVALHVKTSGDVQGVGPARPLDKPNDIGNAAAAGAVWSTAADMARWLGVQLAGGVVGDGPQRLFSASQAREMWTPQTLMPPPARPEGPLGETAPDMRAYALGWIVEQYRGERLVTHTGAVAGGVSVTAILPDKGVALMVMTNGEERGVTGALMRRTLDHYLGVEAPDWVAVLAAGRDQALAAAQAELAAQADATPPARRGRGEARETRPSLPLAGYAGRFRDDWYGDVVIREEGRGLEIEFTRTPGMVGALAHHRLDTFRTRWRDRAIEDAYLTFQLDAEGRIDRVLVRAVSPTADFSFNYQDLLLRPATSDAAPAGTTGE